MAMVKLAMEKITADRTTQVRAKLNEDAVEDYALCYRVNGLTSLPPLEVVYDGETYWLVDGFHRLEAAYRVGWTEILCEVINGTKQDAQWAAFRANQTHGLRRSVADKLRALELALKHPNSKKMSDSSIAAHVGVDHKTVTKYRTEPSPDKRGRNSHKAKPKIATIEGKPEEVSGKSQKTERKSPLLRTGEEILEAESAEESEGKDHGPEDEVRDHNNAIENFCRELMRRAETCPDLHWLRYQDRRNFFMTKVKNGLDALRAGKTVICPACQGSGCEPCDHQGHAPKQYLTSQGLTT